jgi:hypothetical protein
MIEPNYWEGFNRMYCFIVAKRKIFSLNASGIALSMIVSTKRWVGGVDKEGLRKWQCPKPVQ